MVQLDNGYLLQNERNRGDERVPGTNGYSRKDGTMTWGKNKPNGKIYENPIENPLR